MTPRVPDLRAAGYEGGSPEEETSWLIVMGGVPFLVGCLFTLGGEHTHIDTMGVINWGQRYFERTRDYDEEVRVSFKRESSFGVSMLLRVHVLHRAGVSIGRVRASTTQCITG